MRYLNRSPLFWVILGVSCSITVLAVFWDSRLSFGGKHILYICSALAAFGLAIYFGTMEKKNKKGDVYEKDISNESDKENT